MLNWPQNTSQGDWKRLEIITKLMDSCPELVKWMFKKDKPELFDCPEVVLQEAGCYSSGEQILIRVALDVWCWNGDAKIVDICRRLDGNNFRRVMEAMLELHNL